MNPKFPYRGFAPLALALILTYAIAGCAMFQKDPVGSSLITSRNAYESVIKESGEAYKAGAINAPQLKQIVDLGRKFHDAYGLAVDAHLLQNQGDAEKYQAQVALILTQMQELARKYFAYGGGK